MNLMIKLIQQNQIMWDLFTRKEEYIHKNRGKWDRFPFSATSNKNILVPIVSDYIKTNGYRIEYPEDYQFAVCLTHDIDNVYQSRISKIYHAAILLRHGHIQDAKNTIYGLKSWKSFWWNFKEIMSIEEQYGAKSTFFFKASIEKNQEYSYNIVDLQDELNFIVDSGWEVGLHCGCKSYNNINEMLIEKKQLENLIGRSIAGCRNHYLRFRVPESWDLLYKAGFKYDTTFGYAEQVGFRNGMCYPFRPYHLTENRVIDIIEIPLIIMDTTLFGYMGLDMQKAWDVTKYIIDVVEKCNGVVTILWHNTNMNGINLKFYKKILQYCSEKNAWMTCCEKISNTCILL